jgi:exo-beta-1,3-glucanase (GH17 family)
MKKPIQMNIKFMMRNLFALSCVLAAFSVTAVDRGININPEHSPEYVAAQWSGNLAKMKSEITTDLNIAQKSGFSIVKTYYSSYSTIGTGEKVKVADLACPMGLKLMLGVYEFTTRKENCADWCEKGTKDQVKDAVDSINQYPQCIVGVVVGNEIITNNNYSERYQDMEARILNDVKTIKQATNKKVPVGSAQQDGAFLRLLTYNDKLSNDLIANLDFIGVNIYPYWSGTKEAAGHQEFLNRYNAVKSKFAQPIIVTEEGWPSIGAPYQNPDASIQSEKNYYRWWQERATGDSFDSYYFSLFDLKQDDGRIDADKAFGLCDLIRNSKGDIITTCGQ